VPLVGKRPALVDQATGMGVSAADLEAARVDVPDVRAAAEVVDMVADFADLAVVVGVEVLPRLTDVAAPGDHVEQVRDDARRQEAGAVLIVIIAPRIACAFREDLELLRLGVIAPDAGVDRHALVVGCAGLANARMREHAMAAIEPPVGPPDEAVERLVSVLI